VASRPPPPDLPLDALTRPREAGTPAAAAAREAVAEHLTRLGYAVELHRFRFHPSALWAFPLLGTGLGWLGLVLVPLLAFPWAPAWAAPLAWTLGAASLGLFALGVGSGTAPLPLGGGPREDANLIATRAPEVRRWIVAHLDTKAQGHSMAGRLAAVWVVGVAGAGLTALAIARAWGPLPLPAALAGALIGLGAAVLAGQGRLVGQSPGARDNGSGVVAALTAAAATEDPATGVLITGAEEFGLVGARVLARERPGLFAGREVLNFDTLDETGRLYVVSHDPRGDAAARTLAAALAGLGLGARPRRLPIGILVDSLPLARAGATAITLARLDWSTLRRIHTPVDTIDAVSFKTAMSVGRAALRTN
jgi:hypothetical protein